MANSKIYKLIDLIEDVKKVEEMITLHQNDDSDFMLTQYQAKKVKLTGELIAQLNAPALKSASSFFLIKRFLDRFYADSSELKWKESEHIELRELEAVL